MLAQPAPAVGVSLIFLVLLGLLTRWPRPGIGPGVLLPPGQRLADRERLHRWSGSTGPGPRWFQGGRTPTTRWPPAAPTSARARRPLVKAAEQQIARLQQGRHHADLRPGDQLGQRRRPGYRPGRRLRPGQRGGPGPRAAGGRGPAAGGRAGAPAPVRLPGRLVRQCAVAQPGPGGAAVRPGLAGVRPGQRVTVRGTIRSCAAILVGSAGLPLHAGRRDGRDRPAVPGPGRDRRPGRGPRLRGDGPGRAPGRPRGDLEPVVLPGPRGARRAGPGGRGGPGGAAGRPAQASRV